MNSITVEGRIEYGPAYRWTDEPPTCDLIIDAGAELPRLDVHIEGELANDLKAYHNDMIRVIGELQQLDTPIDQKFFVMAKQIEIISRD